MKPKKTDAKTQSEIKVIAAVIYDVLHAESFTTLADLADATKRRCARLRIPYESGLISAAIALVARSRFVLAPRPVHTLFEPRPEPGIRQAEALEICRKLRLTTPLRRMPPPAAPERPRDRDRAAAMAMIEAEMLASLARCEALERPVVAK